MHNTKNNRFRNGSMTRVTIHGVLVALLTLAVTAMASAQTTTNDEATLPPILRFDGGICVIPVTGVAANGTVNLNLVRGVSPGAPWRIADLKAQIGADGHIKVVGRGLLLASGNGIGTNAGQRVHATLFCGPAATATAHSSNAAGVPLEANGDFKINDFVFPVQPTPCDSPVLLILNPGRVWFAAGIPKVEDHK